MKHSLRSLVLVGTAFLFSTCAHKEGPGPHTKKVVLAKGPVSSLVKKGAAARNLVKGTVVKNAEIITVGPGGSLEIALVRDTLGADQNSGLAPAGLFSLCHRGPDRRGPQTHAGKHRNAESVGGRRTDQPAAQRPEIERRARIHLQTPHQCARGPEIRLHSHGPGPRRRFSALRY